jgi:hypothetical protein
MSYKYVTLLMIFLVVIFSGQAWAGEPAPQKVYELADKLFTSYGSDKDIVAAVKKKNSQGETLDQVKEFDDKWRNTPGTVDFMIDLITGPAGLYLTEILNSEPYYAEIFIMDKNGANVAMTGKTSDYWQGDEDKFIKAFNDGKGAVFVDDVEFDESVQSYLVQISIPVMDGDQAIGAITFGIDLDAMQ